MEDPAFERLASDRLVLRRFRASDAASLTAYRNDPEVARFQGWDVPYGEDEAHTLIASLAGLSPGTPGRWFQIAMALPATDELVGDFGVYTSGDGRQAKVGFTLSRAHQGRGLAFEGLTLLQPYLFRELGLHRLYADTDARNVRSRRLLARAGFREEGLLVDAVWAKGEWCSGVIFARLAREWRAAADLAGGGAWA